MSVNTSSGIVTYTNNGDGATSDSFVLTDASDNPFTINVAIAAATSPITVSPASLPAPNVGTPYSQTLSATGGTAPYSFVLTGGSLPPGLSFSGATISGTPNQAGSYTSTFTVTDNLGATTTKSYTVIVPNPSNGITVGAPPTASLNAPYSHTLSASGALAPYTFSIQSGALPPGLSLAGGVISGTPTAIGTYNFDVVATDSSPNLGGSSPGPYFNVVSLSLTVENVPPTAGSVSATVSYDSSANPITLNISGASASSVAVGTAPSHGTATAAGTSITYTPNSGYAGSDSFTYTATNGAGTSAPATVTITVSPPTIAYTPANPPTGTVGVAYSQSVAGATGGAAPYTYTVVAGTLPSGLTLAANGTLSGTPTTAGPYSFSVRATDSSTGTGPFSATSPALAFTINPAGPAIASVAPGTGSTVGGTSVTVTGSGFTGATAVSFGGVAATSFTVDSDTSITAVTPAHAAGAVAVAVTAPGGSASLPAGFTYAAAVPTVANHTVQLVAGTTATVDLTQGATGGPFTAAAIVTPPPSSDGTASIVRNGGQWQLAYAATPNAAPTVIVRYTLSNASGTSSPGTVTFTIIARPDPSRDPEVIGLLNAQAQSAQRFAKSQITNFRDRLEQLHDDSNREATSLNVRLGIPQDPNDPNALGYAEDMKPYDPTREAYGFASNGPAGSGPSAKTPTSRGGSSSDLAFWAGGFVNFGTTNRHNTDLDHTLVGVSGGADYRFSPNFTAGIGFGYGRDSVDVGANGTESNGQAFSAAIYGSYHPRNDIFVDGLLGYSALDFGSKRFVTSTSGFAEGDRPGSQVFGSLSTGYESRGEHFLFSPYGRIEAAWTQLNAFMESGAGSYDLIFGDQYMDMLAGVIGLRTEYDLPQDWGLLKARGRLEYTHDFSGSSWASMGYADLNSGLPYSLSIDGFTRDYVSVGLGFDASVGNGATIGFDYTTAIGFEGKSQDHNFALRFGAKF
ncbi:hypothetical protein AU467_32090 [Mesorhizobium loti]|uniref:Autotransporter domain-containing protein n=1 Tax=Rhizobium loti TaxID=381 RepID=A0A101KNF7_RHILI|nr:hypothetical protein AU467_32090 [Mesorhizobium loti]